MLQKFLIVLFATVLYDGVTCAPTNGQTSDANLPEEKPPTVSTVTNDHMNQEMTTSLVEVKKDIILGNQNMSASGPNTHSAVMPNPADKHTATVTLPPNVDVRNNDKMAETKHEVSTSKNISQAVENKNMSQVVENRNVSQVVENKNVSPVIHNENSKQPISANNVTVPKTVPSSNNSSSLPSIPPVVKTSTKSLPNPTQATMKTTVKPATFVPTSSSTDKATVEHSKPAPSEEKHFDGPSFIGGIVLTIGLTAIGFIAFKYYKSGKIDRNYRTL